MPTLFNETFDTYTATGLSPGGTAAGTLDSNIWRAVGFSDAQPGYGGAIGVTTPANDYARGVIAASGNAVSTAGLYYAVTANAGSGDHALLVQPTGAEFDVNGYLELRVKNTTGAVVGGLSTAFDWVVHNNDTRSENLTVFYSIDGTTFTRLTAGDFSTPTAADVSPAPFNYKHEALDISGVTVAPDAYLYLRFTHLSSSGSGGRDEVGLDNVSVSYAAASTTPVLSVANVTQNEGNSGTTAFVFTVTRAGDTSAATTVHYATADRTATAGSDYTGVFGDLTFNAGETAQTVSVLVNGDTVQEPSETFTLTLSAPTNATLQNSTATGTITNDDVTVTGIATIQGAAQTSPFAGETVTTAGVVTAIKAGAGGGFYIQDDPTTGPAGASHGLFVFTNSTPAVAVGDAVTVQGVVTEYTGGVANNLPVTELNSPVFNITSHNNTVTPIVIGTGGILPPTETIAGASYDPAHNGIDFYESLEGQIVTVKNAQAVDATYQSATWVVADLGAEATGINARGGITITATDFNPERIQIYSTGLTATIGEHLGDITGVITYFGGEYELIPTAAINAPATAPAVPDAPPTTLHGDANHLSFATYNVENLDPGDPAARFAALGYDIATSLGSPDIVTLEEVQDADGAGTGSDFSAAATLNKLIAAISAAGGPTYKFIDIAPTADTGGEPNGHIQVGFLYNPDRVGYVAGSAQLIHDQTPGQGTRTGGDAFYNSREPLLADFTFNGQTITAVGVHNYSRGGSEELFGAHQPPTNSGDDVRLDQSNEIRNFLTTYQAAHANQPIVLAGDFNAFYFEPSLTAFSGGALNLSNLVTNQPVNERYSTEFQGLGQQIDNILVSSALTGGARLQTIHVNTGRAPADQASDHDPVVSLLTVGAAIAAGADSYAGTEDVTLSVDAAHGVLANDSAGAGHTLTALLGQGPTHGTLSFNADGSFTYKGAADYNGADAFTYTARSDTGAVSGATTVSLSLAAVNDAPRITAAAPSAGLVEAGTAGPGVSSATVQLTPTDVDSAVHYDLSRWSDLGGGVYGLNGTYGAAQLNTSTNVLTYLLDNARPRTDALAEGAHVRDLFNVTVSDGSLTGATLVGFLITGASDAPLSSSLHAETSWLVA